MIALLLLAAQVTVSGSFQYRDREYNGAGFTGVTPDRPVRAAEVEIIDAGTGALQGSGLTDPSTGAFSIPGIPSGLSVQARVYARRAGSGINAVILNNASANAVYTALSPPITTGPMSTSFGTVTITGGAAPAFNLFDCAVKSFQYQASVDSDLPALPPLLRLYWQAGSSNGTFFSRPLNSIFLLGTSADPDEFDDDIVLHEIGHWVAYNFSKDDTLGGPHSVVDQLDPRTSWSEGWAHYWSAAVRRFFGSEYPAPQTQVDNFGSGNSVFDIEGPSFPALAIMATNELAVAAVLWDITDIANEPFDGLSGNEVQVWQAVNDRIPAPTPITLEDFREGFLLETSPATLALVTGSEGVPGIMSARSILYYANTVEGDGGSGSATPLTLGATGLTLRTIFPAGDGDWYSIIPSAGTLIAETLNPGDGCLPLLQLYAPDGSTLLAAGSPLQYPIAASGTYYLRVTQASTVIENGYYDIRARLVLNVPPVVASVTASVTSGFAPLRVTLTGAASDAENAYLDYQWDFDGDGRSDWASLRGPTVTTTYSKPGLYNATLRVVDASAASATGSVLITVLPSAAPTISLAPDLTSGPAPLAVTFQVAVSGVIPVSYAWDPDGDGIPEGRTLTAAPFAYTYRTPGIFTPRVTVTDSFHRSYEVFGPAVTVTGTPPAVTLAATNGNIPYAAALTVTSGPSIRTEIDLDGDGRYDFDGLLSPEVQRAGTFTVKARVTDLSGVAGTATAPMSATAIGTRGWLVSPRAGDIVSGTSLTLTAEATPAGTSKKVQFQYRSDSPAGAWVDIGGPIVSAGTLFSTRWDVSALPAAAADLRILVDDAVSSGDDANTVLPSVLAPTLAESGGTLDASGPRVVRNAAGVWVFTSTPVRIDAAARPFGNGSALGLLPFGEAFRITGGSRVRLPFNGDGSGLDVHVFDEAGAVWYRLPSRVAHDDGWVEADVIAPGIYALFASPPGDGGGGGRFCSAQTGRSPGPWIIILALGFLACCRRR